MTEIRRSIKDAGYSMKKIGSIAQIKAIAILSPSLNPSLQGRESRLLPLDGGGRVGVK